MDELMNDKASKAHTPSKKLISVIVPAFNEEENVENAYQAIITEFKKYPDIDYEIIFTDNASTDDTFTKLSHIASQDSSVRVLRFARNFGFQNSILTGYRFAKGDAAIQIDCDLEDPPSVFAEFIRLWRAGHDVVIGIRAQRVESRSMIFMRRLYYKILDRISNTPHKIDAGDFRLVDRHILDQLRHINDTQPYVRGIISELACNQIGITYQRNKRQHGISKFPFRQLIKLSIEGIFAYSTMPLRLATYFGIFIALLTTLMIGSYIVFHIFVSAKIPQGFTTTITLILFGISLNALFLGIIGEYVGRIYNQLRNRPIVVISKMLNVEQKDIQ
jgi:polyisoprenyl-phosphate glycosyltransferase